MRLRLRQLLLKAETAGRTYGRDLSFADGLNVIRADNTHGKSTVMQSIIYALGLEGMIDPRHEVPLPPAMTDTLRDEQGNEHSVHESFVMLEIENESAERLTCQRWVRHERMNRHLIRTWRGGTLSDRSGTFQQEDYFVRRPGAAQRERGFHYMLAQFLGWQLPLLQRDEGDEVPLYLEMLFPLFYVEQKRGWGGIQATMPTYGIPNARRRAIEFILDLGVYRRARERNALANQMEQQRSAYSQTVARFRGRLQGSAVLLQGLDVDAPTRWPEVEPRLMVAVGENRWIALAEHLSFLRGRLREVVERQVPTAEQASRELEERLRSDERALERLSAAASELHERLFIDDDQIDSLVRRTEALEEDRRRYQDALTLQRLGADEPAAILEGDECPACHRPLPAGLAIAEVPPPMSLDENLQFIGEQIRMFRLMQEDTERSRDVEHQRLAALHAQIDEIRKSIRAARATLISPSNSPSMAAVREQLHLEDQISSLQDVERDFAGLIEEIRPIVDSIARIREQLMSLPTVRLDPEDESKLSALERSIVSQLAEYGFRSFPVATIGISRDDYLPTREGFDLGFVTSASDAIRIVWSYLLGLLEVSRTFPTNHPGLVMFDEPRQQAADPVSFQALLRRAATVVLTGGQIVFATSEPAESLQAFLDGMRYELITFEDMALEPME